MALRRDKGDGSIIKRVRNGKTDYVARLTVPRDVARSGRIERIGKTQQEARQLLAQLRRSLEGGQLTAGGQRRVEDYLKEWLEQSVRPRLRLKTYASYEQIVRVHLIPALGHHRLAALAPQDVRRMVNDLLARGRSPRTAQYAHAVLRAALNQAINDGHIASNAAARTPAPRLPHRETIPFSTAQAKTFLAAVRGHRLEAVYSVAFALGLREGEVVGLRWQDIDLDDGRLSVRRSIGRVRGRLVTDEPKSIRSRRTIALPSFCVAALRTHRDRQRDEQRLAGDRWREHGLVFPSTIGTVLEPRNLLRHFQETCRKLGLRPEGGEKFVFHDLRHTAASFLLAQGVPLRVVMEILGHSQISLTANTYSHVAPEVQREAADRMDALMTRLSGDKVSDKVSKRHRGKEKLDGGQEKTPS